MTGIFKAIDGTVSEGRAQFVVWAIILLLMLLAVRNRFIQDDAFISFRYAQHLAAGDGLTWNVGEERPVEGYTNFLWVILIALADKSGFDPVRSSMVLGLVFGAGTLYFTYRLAMVLIGCTGSALVAVLLLGTNYSFSSYMTGGLETQLQSFLAVVCACLVFRTDGYEAAAGRGRLSSVSILFALAMMTRLDSALFCAVFWWFAVRVLRRAELTSGERTIRVACLTIPAIIIVGAWLAWKMSYYGDVLPNTYYVKGAGLSLEVLKQGVWYLGSFLWNYLLIVFVCLALWKPKFVGTLPAVHWTVAMIGLWCLYVIKVGGDFMEYRILVPMLPFALVLTVRILWGLRNPKVQVALVCVLLLASLRHAITYAGQDGFESIASLEHHVRPVGQGWSTIGSVLGELFQDAPDPVTIATTAAGAIPYYSELRTIDMLGLNDRWIAKHGIDTGTRPGHAKCAPLAYLLEENVNLVIGHPQISPIAAPGDAGPQDLWCAPMDVSVLPTGAKIVEIPFDARRKIEVLYLKQHDYVDEVIKRRGLVTRDIVR